MDYRGESRPAVHPAVFLEASFAGQLHVWKGTIDRVEGEIDVRTRMLFAVARVPDPYGRAEASQRPPLAAGLFVEATILGRNATNVVVLPRKALYGKDAVLVVDGDDTLRIRQVDIWRVDRREAIIRSGLASGERVCLSKLDVVKDGMAVRVALATVPGGEAPPGSGTGRGHE
jgi:multidrug efflux pump subunit AcrA (membrane-fusion protein)